jgi:hypothetical protein
MRAGAFPHPVSRQQENSLRTEMPDDIDFEYATAVADRARDLMSKQAARPSPTNIRIWFQYSVGISPEFDKTIGILVADKRPVDAVTIHISPLGGRKVATIHARLEVIWAMLAKMPSRRCVDVA